MGMGILTLVESGYSYSDINGEGEKDMWRGDSGSDEWKEILIVT